MRRRDAAALLALGLAVMLYAAIAQGPPVGMEHAARGHNPRLVAK